MTGRLPHPALASGGAAAGELRLSSARGRWVLLACVLASSLVGIDGTVAVLALPAVGRDLHAGFADLQWVLTGGAVCLASLILLAGAAGDRFGRRAVLLVGVAWSAAASSLCALAPGTGWLIGARVLQGAGGALLVPTSLAIIDASYSERDRSRAIGAWAGLSGIASAVAPFVGGWLLAVGSWRWVFVIDPVLAVPLAVLAVRHLPESRDPAAAGRLDLLGGALCVLSLGSLSYATIAAPARGALSAPVLSTAALAVLALVGFGLVERRARQPLLPLDIFASRQFTAANVVTFLLYAAINAFAFLVVVELQVVAGYSPLEAGSVLVPLTVLVLLLSPWSGALSRRVGPRPQMTAGPLLCAAGLVLVARLPADAAYATAVLPAVTLFALGLAVFVAPLTSTVLSAAAVEHAGVASGVNTAVARTAGLVAVAALPAATGLSTAAPAHVLAGFHAAMWACVVLMVLGAGVAAATIRRPRPALVV